MQAEIFKSLNIGYWDLRSKGKYSRVQRTQLTLLKEDRPRFRGERKLVNQVHVCENDKWAPWEEASWAKKEYHISNFNHF